MGFDDWIGQPFPLSQYVDIGSQFNRGRWVVVLHKPNEGTTSTYTTGSLFRAIGSDIVASWATAPRTEAYAGGN